MQRREVEVGGWEHACCGPEIHRYETVRWRCAPSGDRWFETHHELDDLAAFDVTGTVVDLEAVQPDGSRIRISRVPSGVHLRLLDDDAAGLPLAMYTDDIVDVSTEEFIVTLEVPDPQAG